MTKQHQISIIVNSPLALNPRSSTTSAQSRVYLQWFLDIPGMIPFYQNSVCSFPGHITLCNALGSFAMYDISSNRNLDQTNSSPLSCHLFRVGFYLLFVSLFFWRVFLGRQEVLEPDKTFSLSNLLRKGRTEQGSAS